MLTFGLGCAVVVCLLASGKFVLDAIQTGDYPTKFRLLDLIAAFVCTAGTLAVVGVLARGY